MEKDDSIERSPASPVSAQLERLGIQSHDELLAFLRGHAGPGQSTIAYPWPSDGIAPAKTGSTDTVPSRPQGDDCSDAYTHGNDKFLCFGQTRIPGGKHDDLKQIDARIWRGDLDDPDRSIDGHPSWNAVVREYCAILDRSATTIVEADTFLDTKVYKGGENIVLCAGCDRSIATSLKVEMLKMRELPRGRLGIWVCKLLLSGDTKIHVLVRYQQLRAGGRIGHWQLRMRDGNYTSCFGLATGAMLEMHDPLIERCGPVSPNANNIARGLTEHCFNNAMLDRGVSTRPSAVAPTFVAINSIHTKRKTTELESSERQTKMQKSVPSTVTDNTGPMATFRSSPERLISLFRPQSSTQAARLVSSIGSAKQTHAERQFVAPLHLYLQPHRDYSLDILGLLRMHESKDTEAAKKWAKRPALRMLAKATGEESLESTIKPLYFRPNRAEFKALHNMEAALVQMTGEQVLDDEVCDNCNDGNGPFTTCVVHGDTHKGACANCIHNGGASRCSIRREREEAVRRVSEVPAETKTHEDEHNLTYPHAETIVVHRGPQASEHERPSEHTQPLAPGQGCSMSTRPNSEEELYYRTPPPRALRSAGKELTGYSAEDSNRCLDSAGGRVSDAAKGRLNDSTESIKKPVTSDEAACELESSIREGNHISADKSKFNLRDPLKSRLARSTFNTARTAVKAKPRNATDAPGADQPQRQEAIDSSSFYDEIRAAALQDPPAESAKPAASISDPNVYNTSFLDSVTLVVTIEDDPTVFEMGLGGCSTLDALMEKLTNRRFLGQVITDHLAIVSIKFRVSNNPAVPTTFIEPGNVTLYARLLKHIKACFEDGGKEEIALEATIELATSV
ncbi:hypothetical protein LTR97_006882 [Elasticomyces elasticus]|uniref:Uncharacterized protein n=1 Tax=Elasticomyces elasticus TaxID=574655 RepID=A0AAN8A196_9PEZI|nr:hypothetical protein LTR97_006882 [Elasticomyces elasticus]